MKLGKLNEWMSLSANLGVLIGIIFLIYEISLNTRAVQSDVAWSRAQFALGNNAMLIGSNETAEWFSRVVQLSEDEFEDIDRYSPDYLRAVSLTQMERVYQETRYLTRTATEERAEQAAQLKRYLGYPYRSVLLRRLGWDDLDQEFAVYFKQIIREEGYELDN